MRKKSFLCLGLMWIAVPSFAASESDAVQPYIDSLKQKHELPEKPPEPRAPVESGVAPTPKSDAFSESSTEVQPYIEQLREKGALAKPDSATQTDKATVSEDAKEVQPYIESLKVGKELNPKYKKLVDSAAGFNIVAKNNYRITSKEVQANSFEDVYRTSDKYSVGFDLFYEHQIFRNRFLGAFGPMLRVGFLMTKGKGIFTKNGSRTEDTEFRFQALPVTVGVCYRLVQGRFVVPYVQLGGAAIPFLETRSDDLPSKKGWSRGISGIGGVAFNLDWIGRQGAWEQYDMHGIIHTYLVVQYQYMKTLVGKVDFNYSGLFGGLTFEF